MSFYTDWFDYTNVEAFIELPKSIKNDVKFFANKEYPRPDYTDISMMLENLADIYIKNSDTVSDIKTMNIIKETLVELGDAARKNELYRKSLLHETNFAKYCALFSLVYSKDGNKLEFLHNLCKELAPNLKFIDVLDEQNLIAGKHRTKVEEAAMILKQIKNRGN